ncbi:MAG: TetR/AcrR family transcriptional regulator [Flammeovirgaceae bacterium]
MSFTTRQIEIIEQAFLLIDEGGLQKLTTKNLAEAMGFTEPAIYRHFKNKVDLLNAILRYYQTELRSGMEVILDSNEIGLNQLQAVVLFQFQKFAEKPGILMVIFSEMSFQYEGTLLQTITQTIAQKEKRMERIISKGQEDGSIRKDVSAIKLAHIIMGSMRFTALRWKLSAFNFDLEEEAKLLQHTLTTLLTPPIPNA